MRQYNIAQLPPEIQKELEKPKEIIEKIITEKPVLTRKGTLRKGCVDWNNRLSDLKSCINAGMTMPELAAHFNTKAMNISQVMYRNKLRIKKRADTIPDWKIRDIIAMRKAKYPLQRIGDKYGHHASIISNYLSKVNEKLWEEVEPYPLLTKGVECDKIMESGNAGD